MGWGERGSEGERGGGSGAVRALLSVVRSERCRPSTVVSHRPLSLRRLRSHRRSINYSLLPAASPTFAGTLEVDPLMVAGSSVAARRTRSYLRCCNHALPVGYFDFCGVSCA
ncbi:hypothetical protein PVAP13_9NG451546 [Panicum virgatum]|uniref:Uncharacterized protein n=1 Tax=Panicum virgatum TaxID=38727 RepID=A0A8T0MME3_PANVG|nr:hypothetical protein PVAP13_9NG451546 [Panicum virgatum]